MRRATIAAVSVGVLLIALKLAAWLETNSVSILLSLVDYLTDALASLVNLFAVRHALFQAGGRLGLKMAGLVRQPERCGAENECAGS